jgi:phage portal protein BeeE
MIKIDSINFSVDNVDRWVEKSLRNEPFVRWGLDNMEVERLYWYTDFSPIHNACIRSKVDNAAGQGFVNDYKINNKEYINDVIKQMFWEFIVTGNLFLEIVWKKDRREGIAGFHVIPSKFMRAKQPKDAELYSDYWLYCHDWALYKKAGMVELKEFDPQAYEDRQIVHIKQYQPGYIFYGSPDYSASLLDIRLSRAISEHNLHNIYNGASPSLWVHLPETAPDSQNEQENILRRMEERYVGAKNAGRIILSWGGPDNQKPEITQISQNLQAGMFQEIFALVRENILAGHKIPDPSLIGLPSPTGFSSQAEQLTTAQKLFMSTTIRPLQQFIVRELEPILQLMYPGQEIDLTIKQNVLLEPDEL